MRRVRLIAEGKEGDAAWEWLESVPDLDATRHPSPRPVAADEADVLWIHGPADLPEGLLPWIERGGRLLGTLEAAGIPFSLGIEPVPPDDVRDAVWRHADDEFWLPEYRSFKAFPHVRGLAAFGPHPLFAGLNQGTYVWAPADGEPYRWTTYRQERPARGSVVATERSFIHLNAQRAIAWEHAVGEGGVLSIGGLVHLASADDLLSRQLRAMLRNALLGDAIPHRDRAVPVSLWPVPGSRCHRDSAVPVPAIPDLAGPWAASNSPIAMSGPITADEPWTLAGRRILLAGGERTGLHEAWSHPFRILREASVHIDGQVPVPESIRVAPEEVTRTLRAGSSLVHERWTTVLERPCLVWDLASETDVPIKLRWVVDLRRMWPFPEGNYGDLRWNLNETSDRLWIGASGAPVQVVFALIGGRFHQPTERSEFPPRLDLEATGAGRLRVIAVAATESPDLARTMRAVERKRLDGLQRERAKHAETLAALGPGIETPEPDLALAFEWAKVRTDSFLAETPGVGRSLLAGYAASRPGWGDGRPGYAWYFGRDACWTAFAQLAAGQREAPRDVIRFLSDTQDVSGKILHEYTTSGLVHYDAADSTPLYLLLVARYAVWTGDLDYLRKYWPAVERAYRFCLETDRDGDGLIENTRVGHGWIEHGPLGGAHVTLYLAACWVAALEGLEPIADMLGGAFLGDELRSAALRARDGIRRRFRADGEFALGLLPDGTPQMHRTAMLAVPILLGVIDPAEATTWLDAIAEDGFTAPWGVRLIAKEDPLFDPQGYHAGAVWPLYTGWVSLAEWKSGRFDAALAHLRSNASLVHSRARGAFDEVLHGLDLQEAGVCADQAWSAAMLLSPVVEGLWGVTADALNAAVTVEPWLPPSWPRMALRRLRVGRTVLDVELRARPDQLIARVRRTFGPDIQLNLAPRGLPEYAKVLVDDTELSSRQASFQVRDEHEVIFLF